MPEPKKAIAKAKPKPKKKKKTGAKKRLPALTQLWLQEVYEPLKNSKLPPKEK